MEVALCSPAGKHVTHNSKKKKNTVREKAEKVIGFFRCYWTQVEHQPVLAWPALVLSRFAALRWPPEKRTVEACSRNWKALGRGSGEISTTEYDFISQHLHFFTLHVLHIIFLLLILHACTPPACPLTATSSLALLKYFLPLSSSSSYLYHTQVKIVQDSSPRVPPSFVSRQFSAPSFATPQTHKTTTSCSLNAPSNKSQFPLS